MDKPQILHNTDEYDFYVWYTTKDPVFSEMCKKSRVPQKWYEYKYLSDQSKNSLIKPINRYVEQIYIKPELVSIDGNTVRLRQGNSAQFFLKQRPKDFYNIDRFWMRQYYKTEDQADVPPVCWEETFKFFVPWYIDADVLVRYERPDVDSPFLIQESESKHTAVKNDTIVLEPDFVRFNFKKQGSHMVEQNEFGKIKLNQPMFDMVFECNDIMIERVKEYYNAQN